MNLEKGDKSYHEQYKKISKTCDKFSSKSKHFYDPNEKDKKMVVLEKELICTKSELANIKRTLGIT